jgi:hypothetical protein
MSLLLKGEERLLTKMRIAFRPQLCYRYTRRLAMETITEVLTQAELRRRARVRDEYRRRVGLLQEWDVEGDETDWPTRP